MKQLYLLPALLLCGAALAQTSSVEPSAQQIIDALKTKPATATPAADAASSTPKPRRTRNFAVEAATPEASGTPAPSPTAPAQPNSISLAIQFDVNSDRVQPASMQTLAALATAMKSPELSKMRFRLEGHTDASGQAAYNRKLSAMRAESVKRVLVINQVAPDRLVTEGKGSSEPLNPADPGAAENRRVRIVSLEP
ncbi:OmpA family protein [Pseudoduganella rivuli]|uniref:OmpA family protein n=1 Tax=Pseudoduganella rivuli TaxID=2666085 RepID=UPI0012B0AFB1|nr:OmpA family protein [Pseudoduganella rivuli]